MLPICPSGIVSVFWSNAFASIGQSGLSSAFVNESAVFVVTLLRHVVTVGSF
jgi:hypothetical protein